MLTTQKKLLSLLISQALVGSAQAAVFSINCGATADLINALNTANGNGVADEINLNVDDQADCIYPLTVVNNITEGANGLPSITSNISINGNHSTIRRQEKSEPFRIFHVAEEGQLVLKRLNIEKGLSLKPWPGGNGGGLFSRGNLTLEENNVSGNMAEWGGGGIYIETEVAREIILKNSKIYGNTAQLNNGGGIYSFAHEETVVMLINSIVSENIALNGGGGLTNSAHSSMMLINSTVSNNTVSNNTSEDRENIGGGILNDAEGGLTLINSIVSENIVNAVNIYSPDSPYDGSGGGIFTAFSPLTLINSTISGNTALRGGVFQTVTSFMTIPQ